MDVCSTASWKVGSTPFVATVLGSMYKLTHPSDALPSAMPPTSGRCGSALSRGLGVGVMGENWVFEADRAGMEEGDVVARL